MLLVYWKTTKYQFRDFWKSPNTIFKVYFIELGLNPWSLTFKASKLWMIVPICMFFNKLNVFIVFVCVCLLRFFLCVYVLDFDELKYWLKGQLYIKINKQKTDESLRKSWSENNRFSPSISSTSIFMTPQYSSIILFMAPITFYVLEMSRSSNNAYNSSSDSDANLSAAIVAK